MITNLNNFSITKENIQIFSANYAIILSMIAFLELICKIKISIARRRHT